MSYSSDSQDLAELKLEQELLQMFELDSQKDLEAYLNCVEQLEDISWAVTIQQMYRAIHTIKGGSVTVKADAILDVATVLEDLLSELRYLETSPPLGDGQLQQMLQEGGEIIASVLGNSVDNQAGNIQSKVERIQVLQKQIQQDYLQDWNEQSQIQIEFAEQGFDLVVLDLEIALDTLANGQEIPQATVELAEQLLTDLAEIGQELALELGWRSLLQEASQLLDDLDPVLWKTEWHSYFGRLKAAAKQGGKLAGVEPPIDRGEKAKDSDLKLDGFFEELELPDNIGSTISDSTLDTASTVTDSFDLSEVDSLLDNLNSEELGDLREPKELNYLEEDNYLKSSFADDTADPEDLDGLLELLEIEPSDSPKTESAESSALEEVDSLNNIDSIDSLLADFTVAGEIDPEPESTIEASNIGEVLDLDDIASLLTVPDTVAPTAAPASQVEDSSLEVKANLLPASASITNKAVQNKSIQNKPVEEVQIPIPLTRLNKSADSIVDTMIAARTVESFYQSLHQDLIKLVNLAKDNVQHITQLRQIQDDYALLENLDRSPVQNSQSPTPERYRKGYMTINRLLENSLRLSEVGTEAEQTAQKTAEKLAKLTHHITALKETVEDSRLIPFKNLAFRVRAILRDLISRYDKPVQLEIIGGEIELDVGTTRRLEPILLHLVRNAFDHGLELPSERAKQGKAESGTIRLSLERRGSAYVLTLQDDGQGIDAQKIEAKAQMLNFPLTQTETPENLLAVICQPGFSSQVQVSEVSGRGVGMDVVASEITMLNGSLSLETALGSGTTFKINFPVPHLLIPCLVMQAGDRNFAIPIDQVVSTSLWSDLEIAETSSSRFRYTYEVVKGSETALGLDLLGYWQPKFSDRPINQSNIGIYVQPQSQQPGLWLLADKLLGKLELKIQPIPQPLVVPEGIMGVSLQADSSLLPVLELSSLITYLKSPSWKVTTATSLLNDSAGNDPKSGSLISSKEQTILPGQSHNQELSEGLEPASTILIVDDAALIRRRIESSLSAYGYSTQTCSDGLEAWNWLQTNPQPLMVITDIEMPNLDGFSLIDRCRQNSWNFPIIVISSRLAEEWGQEARRLGGSDFLTKGFSTGELIAKVKQYQQ